MLVKKLTPKKWKAIKIKKSRKNSIGALHSNAILSNTNQNSLEEDASRNLHEKLVSGEINSATTTKRNMDLEDPRWIEARNKELESLKKIGVFEEIEIGTEPPNF